MIAPVNPTNQPINVAGTKTQAATIDIARDFIDRIGALVSGIICVDC